MNEATWCNKCSGYKSDGYVAWAGSGLVPYCNCERKQLAVICPIHQKMYHYVEMNTSGRGFWTTERLIDLELYGNYAVFSYELLKEQGGEK